MTSRQWRPFIRSQRLSNLDDAVAARVIPSFMLVPNLSSALEESRRITPRGMERDLERYRKSIEGHPEVDRLVDSRRRTMKLKARTVHLTRTLISDLSFDAEAARRLLERIIRLDMHWEEDEAPVHSAIDFGDDLRITGHIVIDANIGHMIAKEVLLTPGGVLEFKASHFLLTCKELRRHS